MLFTAEPSDILVAMPRYLYNLHVVLEINIWLVFICSVFFEILINFFQMLLSLETSKRAFATTGAHPFPFISSGLEASSFPPSCSGLGRARSQGPAAVLASWLPLWDVSCIGSSVSVQVYFRPYFGGTISFGSFLRKGSEGNLRVLQLNYLGPTLPSNNNLVIVEALTGTQFYFLAFSLSY